MMVGEPLGIAKTLAVRPLELVLNLDPNRLESLHSR